MPTSLNTIFPYDPSGTVNRVNGESKPLPTDGVIIPEHAPYYVSNIIIRDQNGTPLSPSEYIKITPVNKHILHSALEAYIAFKVIKPGVTSITYDYFSVGGDYSINQQAADDLRISLLGVQDLIQFNQIRNLPTSFPPIYHLHPASDVSWPGVLYQLQRMAEALAVRDSLVMEQVYDYIGLRVDDIEVDVNILSPNQVSIYWRSTGFCICMGEIVVNDDPTKEVFHNFRREYVNPPSLSPDKVTIHMIAFDGQVLPLSLDYDIAKLTTAGFAIHRGVYTLPNTDDLQRGKAMKRMYIAMGISAPDATTTDIANIVRNYPA